MHCLEAVFVNHPISKGFMATFLQISYGGLQILYVVLCLCVLLCVVHCVVSCCVVLCVVLD